MFSYAFPMCSTIEPNISLTYPMESRVVNDIKRSQSDVGEQVRQRRFSVSAESIQPKDHLILDIVHKSSHEEAVIRAATFDHFAFMLLNPDQYEQVVQAMSKKGVPKHSIITQQGDYADRFYSVQSGVVDCLLDGVKVGQHTADEGFGDLSLLHSGRSPMSYVAATDVVLWEIDSVTFRMIMVTQSVHQCQRLRELVSKIPLFSTLAQDDRYRIADALRKVEYQGGDVVFCRAKSDENAIYIINQGTAIVTSNDKEYSEYMITEGDYFGALIDDDARQVTVIAQGPLCCLTLCYKTLCRILGLANV
ncbi:cyclic nucleotide-binding-like protein [Fennellomyces sp. T-0311]|nr:cyclic nucleotide-binding-like protein [Fennellomyces sp. T-0311]